MRQAVCGSLLLGLVLVLLVMVLVVLVLVVPLQGVRQTVVVDLMSGVGFLMAPAASCCTRCMSGCFRRADFIILASV